MATQFSVQDNKPWKTTFFTIWSGQALSILGSQLVQFALIWHLTIQTGSATVLVTASLAGMLPNVVLGPFIGTLVDRWDRRRIMLIADSIVALATIVLAVLFALDVVEVWHIYAVIFIRSLASTFHGNAMSASTSLMVPVEQLTRIQGLNQLLNGGLNVVAAPLGALLLGMLPMQGILSIDVITALFAILPLAPASAISLAVGGALLVGLMTPITMGPFLAAIQSTVEPDMQARIFSLLSSVGTGIAPLGLMIAGPVADRVGIQAWFLLGGMLCIFMAVTGLFIPAVMNMEKKGNPLPKAVGTNVRQAI